MLKITSILSVLIFLCFNSKVLAQQISSTEDVFRWKALLEEDTKFGSENISFLKWDNESFLVESTSSHHYIDIHGKFDRPVNHVTLNSNDIIVKKDGTFNFHFGYPKNITSFIITVADVENKVYRSQYIIVPLDKTKKTLEKIAASRWRFSAGGGFTRLSFRQKNITSFDQNAITIKGGATYKLLEEKMDLGLSAFFNLLPFSSNSPSQYKIQYFGANGRVVWNLLGPPSSLRINLSTGFYYNTSISKVGFTDMFGPQVYPEFIYVFKNGDSLLLYCKYSPSLTQGDIINFKTNREVAVGSHFSFPISFDHRVSFGFDLSQLSLSGTNGSWASTNTYSLSAGISF